MNHILKCTQCEKYTMKEICSCGEKAITTRPVRYSPGRFAKYRKEAKRTDLEKRGLL